jgi:hypothetical protein
MLSSTGWPTRLRIATGYLSVCGRRIAFDATPKLPGDEHNGQPIRDWPPILRMSDDVRQRVESRWTEFGLS